MQQSTAGPGCSRIRRPQRVADLVPKQPADLVADDRDDEHRGEIQLAWLANTATSPSAAVPDERDTHVPAAVAAKTPRYGQMSRQLVVPSATSRTPTTVLTPAPCPPRGHVVRPRRVHVLDQPAALGATAHCRPRTVRAPHLVAMNQLSHALIDGQSEPLEVYRPLERFRS